MSGLPLLELMTTAETARYLRVGERTLKRWRREGTGPGYVHYGRRVFYKLEDINRWVELQRRS